jgi:hypothetical protein
MDYQTKQVRATDRLFQAESTGTTFTSGTTDFTIPFGNDSASGNFDNGGNYDTTSYEYTVPVGGKYTFYFSSKYYIYCAYTISSSVAPYLILIVELMEWTRAYTI